jgi:maleate cis-trans isomerase
MAETDRVRVGFVSGSANWGSHYDRILAWTPPTVSLEIRPLGQAPHSQYELAGSGDEHIARIVAAVRETAWQAVACTGAPMQMQNPGFLEQLQSQLEIPATTAVEASGNALRALGVHRALLLTPFRRYINQAIADYLANLGVEAVLHSEFFEEVEEASRLTAPDTYTLAVKAFRGAGGPEAIYFQGAGPLDPLPVLEQLEQELGVPVVASNPAMLWHTVSLLGQQYHVPHGGRLLQEWPTPVPA